MCGDVLFFSLCFPFHLVEVNISESGFIFVNGIGYFDDISKKLKLL